MTISMMIQVYEDMIVTLERSLAIKFHENTQALIVSFKFRVSELREELKNEK